MQALAVAGRPLDEVVLLAVTNADVGSLESALREAVARQVLETSDTGDVGSVEEGYRFRHDLLAEAVMSELLPGQRRRLHEALATVLSAQAAEGTGHGLAEVAHHWIAAGRLPDALATSVAAAAAAFAGSAFAEAHQLYEQSLELWSRVPASGDLVGLDLLDLEARAGEAAWMVGELDHAIAHTDRALGLAKSSGDALRRGHLLHRLGAFLLANGAEEASLERVRSALDVLPVTAAGERIRTLSLMAAVLMLMGSFRESQSACAQALEMLQDARPDGAAASLRNYMGVDLVGLGDSEAGLASLRDSLRIAREAGAAEELLDAYNNLSFMLTRADRYDEAVQVAREGIAAAGEIGLLRLNGTQLMGTLAHALYQAGRWDEAAREIDEGLRLRPQGDPAVDLLLGRARISLARGDYDEATEDIETVRAIVRETCRIDTVAALSQLSGDLALRTGELDRAAQAVRDGLAALESTDEYLHCLPLLALGIAVETERAVEARARRETAAVERAMGTGAALLDRMHDLASRIGTSYATYPSADALLRTAEAEVTRLRDREDAVAWMDAAAAWSTVGVPYSTAVATLRAAEVVAASRAGRMEAASLVHTAREIAERLGARPLIAQIDSLVQRARLRDTTESAPSTVSPPRDPASELYGLTVREVEVLALIAAGRTNRQIAAELFITEKTAGTHVSNVLGKLGVASRFDAAAIAVRLDAGSRQ